MPLKHPTGFERQWFHFFKLAAWDRQKFAEWLEDNPAIQSRIDTAKPGAARHIESLDAIALFLKGHRPDLLPEPTKQNEPNENSRAVLQAASASLLEFTRGPL